MRPRKASSAPGSRSSATGTPASSGGSWIERVSLRENFAGRKGNSLDRIKAMKKEGWDVTVLKPPGNPDYVLVLGWRDD